MVGAATSLEFYYHDQICPVLNSIFGNEQVRVIAGDRSIE
jgi:hypothetical protein